MTMIDKVFWGMLLLCPWLVNSQSQFIKPIIGEDVVFEETNGVVAVEAEFYYKQSANAVRGWYRTSANEKPKVGRDEDGYHVAGTSNNAYMELLPDTRYTHGDTLINDENFCQVAGKMAVLHYKVHFNTPGRYYVWARIYSTGTEDNGMHVGLNGTWPEHGQRMQWVAKNQWFWDCKQRTVEVHVGVPMEIYLDIDKPGLHEIQFSMREDGIEFDKFVMVKDSTWRPEQNEGLPVKVKSGVLPKPFPKVGAEEQQQLPYMERLVKAMPQIKIMKAQDFPVENTQFYKDGSKWLAINPNKAKEAVTRMAYPHEDNTVDVIFVAIGENDGNSQYQISVNGKEMGSFTAPMSTTTFEEGPQYNGLYEGVQLKKGDVIEVKAKIASADGKEYSRGRWAGIVLAPITKGKELLEKMKPAPLTPTKPDTEAKKEPVLPFSDPKIRKPDGNGQVQMTGEVKQWHKVTLAMNGPFAHELDKAPNPFTDYRMTVRFTHESGTPSYEVPGYFAADGNAANTGADNGTQWKAHFSPDKTGKWNYRVSFVTGKNSAVEAGAGKALAAYDGKTGEFTVSASDKTGRDFRAHGRLEYVGKHHLQFQGSKKYFLKVGADAPETLLAYEDFDATYTMKSPLKKYEKHLTDYPAGAPTWQNGKGKALIGAVNYLAGKGVNVFSFLTYNAGGDGDNVWPFISRNEKFHYDCSKLDQWGIVFDYGQEKGMYLHFKTQETENDDNKKGKMDRVPESLDGGDLGLERKLYYRELLARYGYLLALNWNLGEENTQSIEQRKAMATYFAKNSPYKHNIILHTYPDQQDPVYTPLLGAASDLTGVSLQNDWKAVHKKTLQWVSESAKAGRPWVVANDEQGSAGQGVPPDMGYPGFDGQKLGYTLHDIRKQTLWGNIMAGGAGVEYYFGYQLPENDLVCEDWRSRDKSWEFGKIAIDFFHNNSIPFWEMTNANALIGNTNNEKEKYCLAKPGEIYLVYLAYAPTTTIDLTGAKGNYKIAWFNPRTGGTLQQGSVKKVKGKRIVEIGNPPSDNTEDWVVIIRK